MPEAEHALHEMLQRASIPALVMCLARITEDGRWLESARPASDCSPSAAAWSTWQTSASMPPRTWGSAVGGKAVRMDVGDEDDVERAGREPEAAGRVDVPVNCAGVLQRTLPPRRAIDEGAGPVRAH